MSHQAKRKTETMEINMRGDWSARDLESCVESVNMIYDACYILQMIWNNDIHDKIIQQNLKKLEAYRSIESLSQWKEFKRSFEASPDPVL